ncbi:MAG: DUF421 domain-containing protein [Longimicrobiales bacterium]|nr:DUF421 domain-containing protein [Longimicrobiales bacterium]
MTAILESVAVAFGAAGAIYATLILLTRASGLRSFSKLSSFDFAITVAFGSIIGGVAASDDPALVPAAAGLAALYTLQMVVSAIRRRIPAFSRVVDNQPLLLMAGAEVIDENLRSAKLTRADLRAKLREANVIRYDEIFAVVMETTGDVSVLHGRAEEDRLEMGLLDGVVGAEKLNELDDFGG